MTPESIQIGLLIIQTLTFIAIVIYVWKTWDMANATKKAAQASEKAIDEMRRSREEESRPYVIVYFQIGLDGTTLHLVIKNIGKLPARNVQFGFDKKLDQGAWNRFELISESSKFSEGIQFLPPNLELKEFFAGFVNVEGLASSYRVRIQYENSLTGKSYSDEQALEWKSLTGKLGAGNEWFELFKSFKDEISTIRGHLEILLKNRNHG